MDFMDGAKINQKMVKFLSKVSRPNRVQHFQQVLFQSSIMVIMLITSILAGSQSSVDAIEHCWIADSSIAEITNTARRESQNC